MSFLCVCFFLLRGGIGLENWRPWALCANKLENFLFISSFTQAHSRERTVVVVALDREKERCACVSRTKESLCVPFLFPRASVLLRRVLCVELFIAPRFRSNFFCVWVCFVLISHTLNAKRKKDFIISSLNPRPTRLKLSLKREGQCQFHYDDLLD